MDHFPLFHKLADQHCVIVGAGTVAARKACLLLRAGADITVIGPNPSSTVQQLADEKQIKLLNRPYQADDLNHATLIVAATDDEALNAAIAKTSIEHGQFVNVVDQPDLGNVIVPSIVDRSPVVAAVSTGGASPVLARLLRGKLETLIPASYGRLAKLAADFRDRVKERYANPDDRRHFWERALSGPIADLTFAGQDDEARERVETALANETDPSQQGEVFLIGAGPGDPDLLTFKAFRLMQQADVVLYDRLVAPQILDRVRRDAERIYVGKARADHAMRQEDINQTLVRLAKEGKRVLRLKGGDPFIFGRGGEEIDTLASEGVPFQVVPGITAAAGCAAYGGIPLTHRDFAQSCTFVTGHRKDGSIDLNWGALAQPAQTVVFYMGLVGLPEICAKLMEHGAPGELPAALVEQGTTLSQKVHIGQLNNLPEIIANKSPKAPTLLIVGDVVNLHEKLNWYHPPEDHSSPSFLTREALVSADK